MRKIISLLAFVNCLAACSSEPAAQNNADAPSVTSDSEASKSQVLSPTKCPKHSKLVNGKCTLQVEGE